MIADLISDSLNIRLITKNIISVFSTNFNNTDSFINLLKHSKYKTYDKIVESDDIISYLKKDYNIYENIFRFVSKQNNLDLNKFKEYLNYFNLTHCLLLHFYELSIIQLRIIENLIVLSSNKQIIILNYIDDLKCKNKFYTLLFNVALDNKCIIVPFRNIIDAANNSTSQCYIKSITQVKILPRFSNEFLNHEFNTHIKYYTGLKPSIYHCNPVNLNINNYEYSFIEIILILLFTIYLTIVKFYNWRHRLCQ